MVSLFDKSAYEDNSAYAYSSVDTTSEETLDNEFGEGIYSNPSLSGPNIGLGDGQGLGISGYTNLSGGTTTDWTELQWQTQGYFTSQNMETDHVDSHFGTALGYWQQKALNSGISTFGIYNNPGGYVYQLSTQAGRLNDVLLQSKTVSPGIYTFNHQIEFTANEAIMNLAGGQDVYQLGNNFIVSYNHDGMRADFFLQVQLYDSRGSIEAYSTIGSGAKQVQGVSSLTGGIYNVTSGIYESPSQPLNGYSVDGAVQQVTSNMDGLHTVTVNVNEALLKLIQEVYNNNPALGSSVLDMSNWSLTAAYVGTESGYSSATGDFYVQDPEVHYDTSKTYTTADSVPIGQKISTIQNMAGQPMGTAMTTSATSSGTNYVLGSGNASIVSQGAWDNVNTNGKNVVLYVANGAAVNGNNGVLTLSGPGATYLAGSYTGLYATLNAKSNVNAELTGTAALHANGGDTTLTGINAGVTFDGSGQSLLVGSYGSLVLNGFESNQSIEASTSGNSYVANNGGSVSLTSTGTLTLNNNSGNSYITADSNVNLVGNAGVVDITGGSLSAANLYYNGGLGAVNVNGDWGSLNGTFYSNVSINAEVQNSASIYNGGSNLALTGNFAALTYNGNGSGHTTLVGDWYSAKATFSVNDTFNATLETGFLTIDNGAQVSVSQTHSSGTIDFNINGGTTQATYGNGNFDINVDTSASSALTLHNYKDGHGSIVLTGGQGVSSSYNAQSNMTDIHAGAASIMVDGNHNVSTSSIAAGLLLNIS